jgi:hypothetical protein
MKKSKAQPIHFEKAYLAHFPLNCSIFYEFGYANGGLQNCFKFQKEQTVDKRVIMIQYR